jgi:Tripartite tricarboxylate transporter TctB family
MNSPATEPRAPARILSSDRIAGTFLVLIAAFAIWQNNSLPLGSLSEPGAGSVPLILALLLGLTGLLITVFGGRAPSVNQLDWVEAPRAIAILLAAGFAIYAFESLGYRITITALLIFLIGVLERRHPISVLAVSVGFAVISYWLFNTLLLVQLPRGPWGI